MSVKLLTEHNLEFLSLKGGCTDSSEYTLVKMPHYWKWHFTALLCSRISHDHWLGVENDNLKDNSLLKINWVSIGFFCWLLLPLWDSVIVVHWFMSILVLQSFWWGRESWLFCLVCLPGVSWLLCGSSLQCHGLVCSLWLWYFLIILTIFHNVCYNVFYYWWF